VVRKQLRGKEANIYPPPVTYIFMGPQCLMVTVRSFLLSFGEIYCLDIIFSLPPGVFFLFVPPPFRPPPPLQKENVFCRTLAFYALLPEPAKKGEKNVTSLPLILIVRCVLSSYSKHTFSSLHIFPPKPPYSLIHSI